MLTEFITAHDMHTEAREALGWEASDDAVLLAAIILTLKRRGLENDQIGRLVALVAHLSGDLLGNLALHLDATVNLANDELAQQLRGA